MNRKSLMTGLALGVVSAVAAHVFIPGAPFGTFFAFLLFVNLTYQAGEFVQARMGDA